MLESGLEKEVGASLIALLGTAEAAAGPENGRRSKLASLYQVERKGKGSWRLKLGLI